MSLTRITQKKLDEAGLTVSRRPADTVPQISDTSSIPDLTDEELIDLFHDFVAWNDYATGLLAQAAVEERIANREVEREEAAFMTDQWKGSSTDRVTIQKAKMANDPKVIAAQQKADVAYAYRKMTESIVQKLDRDSNLLSRELTRRTSSSDKPTRRTSRYT